MTQVQNAAAAAPTVAHARHRELSEDLFSRLACGFPRRETRTTFREMAGGLLMVLEDVNCWTLAEAIGHTAPHRLQHLLSRASWDERAVLDATAAWAVAQLDDGDAVLIADETGDAKSSTNAVGAAPQYSGSLGGVGLCQVAVHLAFACGRSPNYVSADSDSRQLPRPTRETQPSRR